jgi:hypothetical protein
MQSEVIIHDDGEGWRIRLDALLLQEPPLSFENLIEAVGPLVPAYVAAYVAARHWHRRHGDQVGTAQQRLRLLLGDTLAQLGAVAAPLACHAEEIARQFRCLDAAVQEVVGLRVAAGRALVAARAAVDAEHGPGHWEEWCSENVHRSQGDIRKLVAIATAADPEAAAAAEREAAKVRMAKVREDRANVRAVEQRAKLRLIESPESVAPPVVQPLSEIEPEPEIEPPPDGDDIAIPAIVFIPADQYARVKEIALRDHPNFSAWIWSLIVESLEGLAP